MKNKNKINETSKIPYSSGNMTIKQGRKLVASLLPFIKDELKFFENEIHIVRGKA